MPNEDKSTMFLRFPLSTRIEHWVLAADFTILAITGFVQLYSTLSVSIWFTGVVGGIENVRVIHHICAIIMVIQSIVHLGVILYRSNLHLTKLHMMPTLEDAYNAFQAFFNNIGFIKEKPKEGRYTFAEKAEYWALIWGTVIMVVSGLMMWNPVATSKILPGEAIPAAKAAHGGEAILAVLAIIVWHLYFVLIKHFNKSMYSGYVSVEDLAREHPLELADIQAGLHHTEIHPETLTRYYRFILPQYIAISIMLLGGFFFFITFEDTTVIPTEPFEHIAVFSPIESGQSDVKAIQIIEESARFAGFSWETGIVCILESKCVGCHGSTAFGDVDLGLYESTIGSRTVIPGDPDGSPLIRKVGAGDHHGLLSAMELEIVRSWINNGAPRTPEEIVIVYVEEEPVEEIPEDMEPIEEPAESSEPDVTRPSEPDEPGEPGEPEPVEETVSAPGYTWESEISNIIQNKCGSCHVNMAMGGLDLSSLVLAMSVIDPGNPDGSLLVTKVSSGDHPGSFTNAELENVRQWILDGAH